MSILQQRLLCRLRDPGRNTSNDTVKKKKFYFAHKKDAKVPENVIKPNEPENTTGRKMNNREKVKGFDSKNKKRTHAKDKRGSRERERERTNQSSQICDNLHSILPQTDITSFVKLKLP